MQSRDLETTEETEVNGDFFGILSSFILAKFFGGRLNVLYSCVKVGEKKFKTRRTGLIGTFVRTLTQPEKYTRGTCRKLCPDLCACFSDGYDKKLLLRTCECKGSGVVCGKNALCASNKCVCKEGFTGNGLTCCGASLLDQFLCSAPDNPSPSPAPSPSTDGKPGFTPDVTPPELLGIRALTPMFFETSIPNKPAKFNMTLVMSDDGSGCCSRIFARARSDAPFVYTLIQTISPPNIVRGRLEYNVTFRWPVFQQQEWNATYALYIELSDANYNLAKFNSTELARLGFPSQLQVWAIRDTSAPRLLDFKALSPTKVVFQPVTTQAAFSAKAKVDLQIVAQDDLSDLSYVRVKAQLPNGRIYEARANAPLQSARAPVTFNLTLNFEFGERNFSWVADLSVTIVDQFNNQVEIGKNELANRSLLNALELVLIPTPTRLLDFKALSPTRVVFQRVTTQAVFTTKAKVDLQVVAQDDVFDLSYVRVKAQLSNGRIFEARANAPLQSARAPVTFNVTLNFEFGERNFSFVADLSVTLVDQFNNQVEIGKNELANRLFPNALELVLIATPPELVNFTVTPLVLNYTRTVRMRFVVKHGTYRFSIGTGDFSRSTAIAYQYAFLGTAPSSTLNISEYSPFVIMSFSEVPLTIFKMSIMLSDVYGLKRAYSSEELMALGFPGNVTILA
jgi:hypothetical protein